MMESLLSDIDRCHAAGLPIRLRIAPTPSGYLHAGNAVNFRYNWQAVRRHSEGRLLLRIDDLDAARKRPEYVQDIFDSLQYLGIDWDEGPRSPVELATEWSQHHRLPLYHALLERLRATGLLFACAKSRKDLDAAGGKYPEAWRDQGRSLDEPDVAWRIRTPADFPLPDFVVRRRDGLPAYQIASLADDLHFGITHLIRGADLTDSSVAQRFLAALLGETRFLDIPVWHHALLTDGQGMKLSKSTGAPSLRSGDDRR